jgi:hypothetical protein
MTARMQSPLAWQRSRQRRILSLAWIALAVAPTYAATAAPGLARSTHPCRAEPQAHAPAPRGFLGYACRDARCSSHKAGFDWAERNGIDDGRACLARNDPAFTEGCRAFADTAVTAEQAGFHWARANDLADQCLCTGAGPGFEAGCAAYIRGLAD